MAAEIVFAHTSGRTTYAQVRNAVGAIWNTAGAAFEAYNAANVADYDLACTEQGTSGIYTANMPAAVAGIYNVVARDRAGGAPAETDEIVGAGSIDWTATAVASIGSGVFLDDSYDQPLAHVKFLNDPAGSENEYQATFTLNGVEIIPTSATIQVVKPDGTNLIASTAMTKTVGAADTIFKLNTATIQSAGITYKIKNTFVYLGDTFVCPALYAQGRDSTV